MFVPILLAASLATLQERPFQGAFKVDQPLRLALTPKLDGKIEHEEWEALSEFGDVKSYFEWEPNAVHAAATLPLDRSFVASFDLKGDGWLNGDDNIQVAVRFVEGQAKASVKRLDGTRRDGPVWIEAPGLADALRYGVSSGDETWTVEVSLVDVGTGLIPTSDANTIGVRVDAIEPDPETLDAFLPRATAPVNLVFDLGTGLLDGMKWRPELKFRRVAPGEEIPVRLNFEGKDEMPLERVELRSEGFLERRSMTTALPFPKFDRKGRAFVDYKTMVANDAEAGWRVVRGTVTGPASPIVVRTSVSVSPILSVDLTRVRDEKTKAGARVLKFSLYLISNSRNRLDGVTRIVVPDRWKLVAGDDKGFVIYQARGSVRRVIEAEIPDDAAGTFPFRVTVTIGGREIEHTHWITVKAPKG